MPVLPFGKYKGKELKDVPTDYIAWLAGFENTIRSLAETIMLNSEFDLCATWIRNSGVKTIEECEDMLHNSFNDGIMPNCIVGVTRPWWYTYLHHKEWVYRARDEFRTRKLCHICLRPIVPIGLSRKNGREHLDWEDRTTHKSCWRRNMNPYWS